MLILISPLISFCEECSFFFLSSSFSSLQTNHSFSLVCVDAADVVVATFLLYILLTIDVFWGETNFHSLERARRPQGDPWWNLERKLGLEQMPSYKSASIAKIMPSNTSESMTGVDWSTILHLRLLSQTKPNLPNFDTLILI